MEILFRVNPTFDFNRGPKKAKGVLRSNEMVGGEQCVIETDGIYKQPVSYAENLDMDQLDSPQETHRMDKVRPKLLLHL